MEHPPCPPLFCVVGPTASGKTALAVALAERLGGEVVSCDSMQVYRGMDIGTAKPGAAERRGIPHHILDCAEPSEPWSAGRYAREAARCAEEIRARGRVSVVCGGTGLWLRALTEGLSDMPDCPRREHGP
ncbi:MAG: tRNA (adenosine(37)-N6)-dimethylallyltransferase MiaA, partial [Oscillospiraceae bacterium]|nr:tRNA (adenosine(37)-N6)-dimethylallyltransferase MiaA [Oscillospiraceae bacterium]